MGVESVTMDTTTGHRKRVLRQGSCCWEMNRGSLRDLSVFSFDPCEVGSRVKCRRKWEHIAGVCDKEIRENKLTLQQKLEALLLGPGCVSTCCELSLPAAHLSRHLLHTRIHLCV